MTLESAIKRARQLRRDGQIDEAILVLRAAFAGNDLFDFKSRFLLPQYLDIAGQHDEAWNEYLRILRAAWAIDGDPAPICAGRVYGEMASYLNSREEHARSVAYSIISEMLENFGLRIQRRSYEPGGGKWKAGETREMIHDLLPTGTAESVEIEVFRCVWEAYKVGPTVDFDALGIAVSACLGVKF